MQRFLRIQAEVAELVDALGSGVAMPIRPLPQVSLNCLAGKNLLYTHKIILLEHAKI